jgi:hypothetical protein
MLLSTIIKQFADSFRHRYAKNLLPGNIRGQSKIRFNLT